MPATTIGEARKVPEVESDVDGTCMDRGHFSATAGRRQPAPPSGNHSRQWQAGDRQRPQAAYRFLVANYQPGDQISVFGFSRGAAEAQTLVRFIEWVGGAGNARKLTQANVWRLTHPSGVLFSQ